MNRERLTAWNLELQSAHHTLEAALNAARVSITTGAALTSRGRDLTLRCRGFCAALDDHHRSEDAALFPRLLAEGPELTDAITTLIRDHRILTGLLADFEKSLAGLSTLDDTQRDQLDAQLDRIEAVMKNHFSDEERRLHTVLRTFDAEPAEKDLLLGSTPNTP